MKRYITYLIVLFSTCVGLYAQDSSDKFYGWTDEQFQAYEDSLINALFPKAELRYYDISEGLSSSPKRKANVRSGAVIPAVTVDRSKEVGEIKIVSGFTPSGARTYEVPIEVYPGINKLTPQISLAYNSQQGSTVAGQGWSLSGLSAIMRVPKTIYHNGRVAAVNLDFEDSFALDGVRLIETYRGNNVIQYTSQQGNIKVSAHHDGSYISHFEVFYPNGNIGIFGFPGKQRAYSSYPITSLADKYGNEISYTYFTHYNFHYITSIDYNNNCSISFDYISNRPDRRTFRNGTIITRLQRLLGSITCRIGNTVLGEYKLSYETRYGKSLLSEISFSVGDKCYNPLKFYYGDGVKNFQYEQTNTFIKKSYHSTGDNSVRITKGRFDPQSGNEGIITFRNYTPYWKHHRSSSLFSHSQNRFINLYEADEKIFVYTNLCGGEADEYTLTAGEGFIDIVCADLRGNRQDCIIKINNVVSGDNDMVVFHVYEKTGKSIGLKHESTFTFPTVFKDGDGGKSVQPKFYYPGDFNGDGKMEILAISADKALGDKSPVSKIYIFDILNDKILFEKEALSFTLDFIGTENSDMDDVMRNSDKLFAQDCDGDGKTDLCLINASGIQTYTFDVDVKGAISLRFMKRTDNHPDFLFREKRWLPCDQDCDGLVDLICPNIYDDLRSWGVITASGGGKYGYYSMTSDPLNSQIDKESYTVVDINNDGFTDIAVLNTNRVIGGYMGIYLSKDAEFAEYQSVRIPREKAILAPVSLNSKTQHYPLLSLNDSLITRYAFNRNEMIDLALTAMVSSYGVVHTNEYEILTKESTNYKQGTGARFPYINMCEPMLLLTNSSTIVNGTAIEAHSYEYENGILHLQGLGFCGFEKITSTDHKGRKTTDVYDPMNYGVLLSHSDHASDIRFTYRIDHQQNRLTKVLLMEKEERNLIEGTRYLSSYEYDDFGCLTEDKCEINGYGTITKSYGYQHNSAAGKMYFIGLKSYEGKYIVTDDNMTHSEDETISYDDYDQMRPLTKSLTRNGEWVVEEEYSFDENGNLIEVLSTPYTSSNTFTTSYEYDSYGRVISVTDDEGLIEKEAYDDAGRRVRHTDIRGNETTYVYDSFGRIIRELSPEGVESSTSYSWSTGSTGLYKISNSVTGQPSTYSVYDLLSRCVESGTMCYDGDWLKEFKEYDDEGRVTRSSVPARGADMGWNTYSYDDYGRILSVSEASGRTTLNSYNRLSITTTVNGIQTTRVHNPIGEVVRVIDSQGEIVYGYRPDGQLYVINTPDRNEVRLEYDEYGRRVQTVDPNSDTVDWEYDEDGNLVFEMTGGLYPVTREYDQYSKLISLTVGDDEFSYHYNQYGDLTEVLKNGYQNKSITYDIYGRIISAKEYASPQVWLQRDFTYAGGNIASISYSSDLGILGTENFAYANGCLTESNLNGSTVIYKLRSENNLGITSLIETGGFSRSYGFTATGLPASRVVKYGESVIHNYQYSFDSSFNLKSRKDLQRNKQDNFTYDGINRLKSWGNNTIDYEMMGNITDRSDVGSFSYDDGAKPYSVTRVGLVSDAIPLHAQKITFYSTGLPLTIEEKDYTTRFTYNCDFNRSAMSVSQGNSEILLRHYIGGCYEREALQGNAVSERLYLGGDYYKAVAILEKSNSKESLYYIFRDYLGSVRQICKADGTLVQELDYDPWGRLSVSERTPAQSGITAYPLFGRGFTGHEHLEWHGLINMNARLYDPILGRFVSPDPYVQAPFNTQNFNRFTYALNNPLLYYDEDGEFLLTALIVGAVIGGVINVAVHWKDINAAGGGWSSFWKGASYFAVGGIAGAAGTTAGIAVATIGAGGIAAATSATYAAASMGVVPGVMSGMASGAANGLVLGFGNTVVGGGSIGTAFAAGGIEAITGALSSGLTGGIDGGIRAARAGVNIMSGKVGPMDISGHMGRSINDLSLPTYDNKPNVPSDKMYTVYVGYERDTKVVRYVGITKREPEIRYQEHWRSKTPRANLDYKNVTKIHSLTRMEARIKEQNLINYYGLKNLYNKRNEIAPKHWIDFGITPKFTITIPYIRNSNPFFNTKN